MYIREECNPIESYQSRVLCVSFVTFTSYVVYLFIIVLSSVGRHWQTFRRLIASSSFATPPRCRSTCANKSTRRVSRFTLRERANGIFFSAARRGEEEEEGERKVDTRLEFNLAGPV